MRYLKMLALLAFLPLIMNADCNSQKTAKNKYTVHYETTHNSLSFSNVPADVTVEEGTVIDTTKPTYLSGQVNFLGDFYSFSEVEYAAVFAENDNNHLFRIQLGNQKLTVNSNITLSVGYNFGELIYCFRTDETTMPTDEDLDLDLMFGEATVAAKIMQGANGLNYKITKWKDSSGKVYSAGDTIYHSTYSTKDNVILYSADATAVNGYTLSYDGNKSTSGTAPVTAAYGSGTSVTLPGNTGTLKKPGYTFLGWCESKDGSGTVYPAGNSFTVSKNTTLYAAWGKNIMVDFDGNNPAPSGAGNPPAPVITGNNTVTMPAKPSGLTKDGYTFGGWNTRADGTGTTYAEGQAMILTANVTLFAKWNGTTLSGNGLTISAENTTTKTIDSSHKFYYFVSTDQYFRNQKSVVASGSLSSTSETADVDLPIGKYYVYGYMDNDGAASLSEGDYLYASTDYPTNFAFQWFNPLFLKVFNVTTTVQRQSALVEFNKGQMYGDVDCYTYQGQDAVVHVQFTYTGSQTLSLTNMFFMVCSSNTDLSKDWLAGGITPSSGDSSTKTLSFVARLPLNKAYYFGGYLKDSSKTSFADYTGGKYHNEKWSAVATPFTATKSIVYSIMESFGD